MTLCVPYNFATIMLVLFFLPGLAKKQDVNMINLHMTFKFYLCQYRYVQ